MKIDVLGYIDVAIMMVLWKKFSYRVVAIFFFLCLISMKRWLPFSPIGLQVSDIGSSRASCSKIFSSETTERIQLKFLRNVPQCVGSKVCAF